jgi:hypothetical protein
MPKSTPQPESGSAAEAGIALILVLSALAILAIMATHVTVVSEVAGEEAKVTATRGRLAYVAESAADRAFWLLIADRRQYPNRVLGVAQIERPADAGEPWMMDGRPHSLPVPGARVQVVVADADCGMDFSGPNPAPALRTLLVTEDIRRNDVVDRFLDVLSDYYDPDEVKRLHGKESQDYAAEGYPDLPRNAPLQVREEALWLTGIEEVLHLDQIENQTAVTAPPDLSAIRVIPPLGTVFARRSPLDSFFSVSPEVIRRRLNLQDQEMKAILDARQRWFRNGEPVAQNLSPTLLQRVGAVFSLNPQESDVAMVTVIAADAAGAIQRESRSVRNCRSLQMGSLAGPTLVCWEQVLY